MAGREGISAAVAKLRGAVARGNSLPGGPSSEARVHLSAKSAADFLVSAEVLPQLEPRQLALTAWSLARLEATAGWDTDEASGPRALTASLRQRLEEFGPHELSMMLWAFAAGPGKASQSTGGSSCGRMERRKELAEMLAPESSAKPP
ncbi:ylyB [Symbiodinium microadriaticum]|nr:ylyB [Symbiodinium microadriaticum]